MVSFAVRGSLSGVALDVDDADVADRRRRPARACSGSSAPTATPSATTPRSQRTVVGGELRIHSRCPNAVPRACSVSYRVVVPDNVPVTVRTAGGTVTLPAATAARRA